MAVQTQEHIEEVDVEFDQALFNQLLEAGSDQACVTITMPVKQGSRNLKENQNRLKNMVKLAEDKIINYGLDQATADKILKPAHDLVEETNFWLDQEEGLALFLSPDIFKLMQLPLPLEERGIVDKRFFLKPVIPFAESEAQYFVLALARRNTRLLKCTTGGYERIEPPEHLESYDNYAGTFEFEKSQGAHSGAQGRDVNHGFGVTGDETEKAHLEQFISQLENWVRDQVDDTGLTLLLAGDPQITGIYKAHNHYSRMSEQTPTQRNVTEYSDGEIHEESLPVILKDIHQDHSREINRYHSLAANEPEKTSQNIHEIVPAAKDKRIATLFLAPESNLWGHYNPDNREVKLADTPEGEVGEELTNLAAIEALRNNATVILMTEDMARDMPAQAAIFYW